MPCLCFNFCWRFVLPHLLIWLSILLDGWGLIFILLQISLLHGFSVQLFPSSVSLLCSVLSCSYLSFLYLFLTFLSSPSHLFILLIPSIFPSIVFILSYLSLLSLKLSVHSDPTPPSFLFLSSQVISCMPAFILPSLILCFSPPPSRLAPYSLRAQAAVASLMRRIYG